MSTSGNSDMSQRSRGLRLVLPDLGPKSSDEDFNHSKDHGLEHRQQRPDTPQQDRPGKPYSQHGSLHQNRPSTPSGTLLQQSRSGTPYSQRDNLEQDRPSTPSSQNGAPQGNRPGNSSVDFGQFSDQSLMDIVAPWEKKDRAATTEHDAEGHGNTSTPVNPAAARESSVLLPPEYSCQLIFNPDHQPPPPPPPPSRREVGPSMQSQSMGSYRSLALLAVSSSPRDKNRVAKRHYFFFVLAILVFVGVAVGGYFGHLAMKNAMDAEAAAAAAKYSALLPPSPTHHDADSALTTQPPASAPSAIPPPEHPIPMKKGTSLGVAGYVVFGSGVLALYFQGPDTAVYTMVYRSDIGERVFSAGQGAKPIPEGWSDPQPLQIWPSGRTHLAPMALLNAPDTEPDTHLFLTDNGTLHDVVASINLNGSLGSSPFLSPTIETQSLSIATGGSVAAYWPWVVYQGPDGSLFELYNAQQVPAHSPTDTWSPRPLNISAKPGTRLALAPLFSTLNIDRTSKAGYALIYQATDGHLMVDVPDDRVVQNIASDSYYNYIKDGSGWLKAFPNDTIDSPGAVASLSLARFNDTNSRMFTFILYVNDQHDIAVLSNHKKTGWMLSMPSTLQGVDPDTNIACHTLSKSFSVDATSFVDKTLARCYFQRNGQLIEVEYNDEEESWVVLAYYDNGQMHNWYGTGMQGAGATDMPKASATSPEGSHTRASIASITPAAAETHTGNPATPPPTGQPAGQSPGKPTGQPAGSPAGQPTGPPVGQPTAQPAGSPAGQPAGSAPGQPTGPPTGPPAGTRVGTRVEQSAGQPARSHPAQPTVPSAGKPTGLPAGSTSGQSSGQPTLPPAGQPFISSAG